MKVNEARCDLTKEETYLVLAQMMEKDTPVHQEQLLTFIDLLNKDLARHDNKHKILNVLKLMLDKIKAGVYPKLPSLKDTIVSVITQLNEINITETSFDGKSNHQLYLETLLLFPDDVFTIVSLQIGTTVLKLIETYLEVTSNESHCQMVKSLFSKYLQNLTEDDKLEFVKIGLHLWLTRLIPFIFLDHNNNREFGIDIAEELLPYIIKLDIYGNPLWTSISTNIKSRSRYPQFLVNLQNAKTVHWRRLWIFLIKLSDIELHKFGSHINHMLFALQEGFKKDVNCKYQAFLCLQALIENFALDQKILFSVSRIKLVSIALESNNAKTEEIGLLKFDIWWDLISRLQSNIKPHSRAVLMPFLLYCFGEPNSSNSNRKYPGEVFQSIQKLAIKSTVEMFGHVNCSGCINGDFKKLAQPILTGDLWNELSTHWIWVLKNVTVSISSQLPKANKSKSDFESLTQNLRCIWQSFIKLSTSIKPEMLSVGLKLLDIFIDKHSHNPLFAEIIMTIIIPSIVDTNNGYSVTALNDASIIKSKSSHAPIHSLLKFVLLPKLYHADTMSDLHFDFENLIQIGLLGGFKEFSVWLIDEITSDGHGPLVWCYLADALTTSIQQIEIHVYSAVLMWPLLKYNGNSKIANVSTAWRKLYSIQRSKILPVKEKSIDQVDEDVVLALLKIANKTTKNAINLVPLYCLTFVIKRYSEEKPGQMVLMNRLFLGMEKFLNNLPVGKISHILYVSLIESLKQLSTLLSHCHTYHVSLSSAEHLIAILNKNIKIISNYLVQGTQDHNNAGQETTNSINSLLDSLHSLIIPLYFSSIFDNLLEVVNNLMQNIKNPTIQTKCVDLLKQIVEPNKKESVLEKSELIKIQALLIAKKINEQTQSESPSSNSKVTLPTPKTNNKKPNTSLSTKDDFVVIESNWKFDPKNLTEHQKDVLKRRRDDIPALYEDLSQSQDENLMKSWKPPGYNNAFSETSSSQELSSQGFSTDKPTITNFFKNDINKAVPKMGIKSDSEKRTNTPRSAKTTVEQNENILKADKKLLILNNKIKSEIKSNCIESESSKIILGAQQHNSILENKESKFKTPKRSIFSRINDNLKQLKSPNDKNKFDTNEFSDQDETKILSVNVNENKSNINENVVDNTTVHDSKVIDEKIQATHVDADVISKNDLINGSIDSDIMMINENIEPTKNENGSNIFKISTKNVSGDAAQIKRKRSSSDENSLIDYSNENDTIEIESDNINKIDSDMRKDDCKDTTPNRPTRIRRKPIKFITDESLGLKKSKTNTLKDDELLNNKDTKSEEHQSPMTVKDASLELPNSPVTPKSLKKKSRLMNQLAINTNEGYSSIDIMSNKNMNTRKTRRSLITIDAKVNQKKSSLAIVESTKISTVKSDHDIDKNLLSKTPLSVENILDVNDVSCIESTCAELIADVNHCTSKSDISSRNTINIIKNTNNIKNTNSLNEPKSSHEEISKNIASEILNEKSNNDDTFVITKTSQDSTAVDSDVELKDSIKIENSEFKNNCIVLVETSHHDFKTVPSIFSQETEVMHTKKIDYDNKTDELDTFFDNDQESMTTDDFTCGQKDDIMCSPDFIESSQEENLSSMSLKIIISKAKELESSKTDKSKSIDYSLLSSQQIAEAETQPMSGELIEEQNVVFPNSIDICTEIISINDTESVDEFASKVQNATLIELENNQNILNPDKDDEDDKDTQCDEVDNSDDVNKILNLNLKPPSPTSIHFNNSIVSSPCKDDIQDRNRELLNNTIDISPIKGFTFSSDNSPIRKASPDKADTTVANTPKEVSQINFQNNSSVMTSPDLFSSEKSSPVKEDIPIKQISPPKVNTPVIPHNPRNSWLSMKHVGSRTAQMLSLCMIDDKIDDDDSSSVAVEDVSNNRKPPLTNSERWDGVLNFNSISNKESFDSQPLLEFTKLMPSLSASPIGPILKRKLENDDLTISPSSKKKRVSFHDPPVSTTVSVEKYISNKVNKSPQVKDNPTAKRFRVTVAKCLMKTIQMAAAVTSDSSLNIDNEAVQTETETDLPLSDICSLVVDTPQYLNVVQNDMLDSTQPIYPNLIDCQVSINEISTELSSPMWHKDLLKKINKILTIGDLAKLTELEINRLPIKYPKIPTVKQTLIAYETKLNRVTLCDDELDSIAGMDVEVFDNKDDGIDNIVDEVFLDNVEKIIKVDQTAVNDSIFEENTEVVVEKLKHNNDDDKEIEFNDMTTGFLPVKVEDSNVIVENAITPNSLTTNPIEALKLAINMNDADVILDNVPLTSITGYLLRKMNSDSDIQKHVMETLNVSPKSETEGLNTLVKSLRDRLNLDFDSLLSTLDKISKS